MKKIYKYPFPTTDSIRLDMPAGAEILTVQTQHDAPFIWALVDPEAPAVPRHFRMVSTGHPLPDAPGKFIGTFQMLRGDIVFHLFEEIDA